MEIGADKDLLERIRMHFITSKLTAAQNGLRDIVRFIRDWLVVWNMNFIFPFSWECHDPN